MDETCQVLNSIVNVIAPTLDMSTFLASDPKLQRKMARDTQILNSGPFLVKVSHEKLIDSKNFS